VVTLEYRIAAGVIIESDGKVLLQPHFKAGSYDVWGAPVGGALGDKDPRAEPARE
jgi:hypothetical protein